MNTLFKTLSLSILLTALWSTASLAESLTVIVHPSNDSELSEKAVSRIFLGKSKRFSNGSEAIPIDQQEGNAVRADFSSKLLKKSSSQLKAYWSKLIFTGKGSPPKQVASDAEVIDLVSKNPSLIGYVSKDPGDGSVRSALTLP